MASVRLSEFPRTFWVANVMELFERAAYYGMNSVLAVYLAGEVAKGGLGFTPSAIGFLQGIIYAATYVIPILGGALADRYGYRRMLMVAFTLLAGGYAVTSQMTAYVAVFLSLAIMACGAGLFKPIISGSIARTTNEKTSAFGFGIYYWMINLGACVAPLVVSWLKGFSWSYVFIASAIYTGLMLLPTIFLYREPPKPAATKPLKETLMGALEVLGDARFMLMICVYSGFWILYFQNFGSVLWYLGDFIDRTPVSNAVNRIFGSTGFVFDAEHVTTINALTIILLQIVVSWIVREMKALPTMIGGMVIGGLGFVLLALSQNAWVFIAGIAVFSIGEMTAHPKYYSFIGIVAPQDRKAVYMGYAFLYGVFGALLGSNIGAVLYETMLKPTKGTPDAHGRAFWFWMMFAIFDAVAAIGLYLFARSYGEDTAATRRGARRIMTGVYAGLALLGIAFFAYALGATGSDVNYRMAVQALIFVALGGFGLWITWRGRAAAEAPAGASA